MMSDFLCTRAAIYDLLARVYTYPIDYAVLEAISALRVERAPAAVSDALAVMQARIVATDNREELVESLNVEATRLFEGPGQPAAPAYASFYLNKGHLMGEAALAVRRAYLAANALPREDGRIPPDHLALELGFMAYLAHEAASTPDSDAARALVASAQFLRQHLLTWVPRFDAAVVGATAHPFFVGLANLTSALLEADAAWLEEVLETQRHPTVSEVTR